jgi:hypothetical protein
MTITHRTRPSTASTRPARTARRSSERLRSDGVVASYLHDLARDDRRARRPSPRTAPVRGCVQVV